MVVSISSQNPPRPTSEGSCATGALKEASSYIHAHKKPHDAAMGCGRMGSRTADLYSL